MEEADAEVGRAAEPILLFVLPTRHPLSPDALHNPGLVDVVHRDIGDFAFTAGQ